LFWHRIERVAENLRPFFLLHGAGSQPAPFFLFHVENSLRPAALCPPPAFSTARTIRFLFALFPSGSVRYFFRIRCAKPAEKKEHNRVCKRCGKGAENLRIRMRISCEKSVEKRWESGGNAVEVLWN
jgi:hypothetical protein